MTWWNSDNSKWTPEQIRDAQRSYCHVFMMSDEGRRVLAHLRFMAAATQAGKQVDERLAWLDFVEWIRQQCGPQDEMVRIEAEAQTCGRALVQPKEPLVTEQPLLDGGPKFADDVKIENS